MGSTTFARRIAATARRNAVSRAPDVDVGIIYTYERQFLDLLVGSLAHSADVAFPRLILVDNASDEGVSEWEGVFARTKVIRNERRIGYGPNLNRILSASSARYVLLLNTDMFFDPEERVLDRMVAFMDEHPDCGVAGCRMYRADGSYAYSARRFYSLPMIAARRLGWLGRPFSSAEDRLLYRDRDRRSQFECDWLSGCFLMVRREAVEQIGGFDERFEKYFEDVDFCTRMAAGGWKVMFNGATYGYHLEQRASKRFLSRDAFAHLRSYLRWLFKWGRRKGGLGNNRGAIRVSR
ncbi:MAG: glycosyltransferase family 2 protein [Planctomycetaceae bacterium]